MIRFMFIAAPRSGTAWAANWATTPQRLCLHDPMWDFHYQDLDAIEMGRPLGVACTGMALFPDWVNAHPAPKVILHRPRNEVNEACERLGLHHVPVRLFNNLKKIGGMHVDWRALFDAPQAIHKHLFAEPFDADRHRVLKDLQVTSLYLQRTFNPDVMQRLQREKAFEASDGP